MRIALGSLSDFPERTTRSFAFTRGGEQLQAFVANHDGRLVAYVNRCRHRPLPLDRGDGAFYSRDGRHFVCRSHGAAYEPLSGLCVLGPCAGDVLDALAVEVSGDRVWVDPGVDAGER